MRPGQSPRASNPSVGQPDKVCLGVSPAIRQSRGRTQKPRPTQREACRSGRGESCGYPRRLLSGSGVVTGTSGDEARDEGAEESFAPAARVVHELEEAEVVRQLLLRDALMRAEPRAQQRPETLDRVNVDLAEPVPVLVAGVLAAPVTDRLVLAAPGWQAGVDTILVGVDEGAAGDGGRDDRLDRDLLHVGQH